MAVIFQTTFSNAFSWIKMYEFRLRFHLILVPRGPINNIPALVQIMAWRRPGDKPLSEPMMVCMLTHICVTQPPWVKGEISNYTLVNSGICLLIRVFEMPPWAEGLRLGQVLAIILPAGSWNIVPYSGCRPAKGYHILRTVFSSSFKQTRSWITSMCPQGICRALRPVWRLQCPLLWASWPRRCRTLWTRVSGSCCRMGRRKEESCWLTPRGVCIHQGLVRWVEVGIGWGHLYTPGISQVSGGGDWLRSSVYTRD